MGVRLVRHGFDADSSGTYFHNELKHREMPDQHPIESITGLEETLQDILKNASTIQEVINTESISLTHNLIEKTLSADVNISKEKDNLLEYKSDGLFVLSSLQKDATQKDLDFIVTQVKTYLGDPIVESVESPGTEYKIKIDFTITNEEDILDG